MLYGPNISITTAAAAADNDNDDDGSQRDVIASHPERLLLINVGPCSTTALVGYYAYCYLLFYLEN